MRTAIPIEVPIPVAARIGGYQSGNTQSYESTSTPRSDDTTVEVNVGRSHKGRNVLPGNVRNFPLSPRVVTERVQDVLAKTVGEDRHAAKKLARLANSTERTAKNWLAGDHAPSLAAFFNLCREIPELASEARRLMGMEADLDPEFMRDFLRLQQHVTRMRGGAE